MMTTDDRPRISQQATKHADIEGTDVVLLHWRTRLGAFRKAITKAEPTMEGAVKSAASHRGVKVVKRRTDGRWQGYIRRVCVGRHIPPGADDSMATWVDDNSSNVLYLAVAEYWPSEKWWTLPLE